MLPSQSVRPTDLGFSSPKSKMLVLANSQTKNKQQTTYQGTIPTISSPHASGLLRYPMTPHINTATSQPYAHHMPSHRFDNNGSRQAYQQLQPTVQGSPQLFSRSTAHSPTREKGFQSFTRFDSRRKQNSVVANVKDPERHSIFDDNHYPQTPEKQVSHLGGFRSFSPLRRSIFDEHEAKNLQFQNISPVNQSRPPVTWPDTTSTYLRNLGQYISNIQNPLPSHNPLLNLQSPSYQTQHQGSFNTPTQNHNNKYNALRVSFQTTPHNPYAYQYEAGRTSQKSTSYKQDTSSSLNYTPISNIVPSTGSSLSQATNIRWNQEAYSGVSYSSGQMPNDPLKNIVENPIPSSPTQTFNIAGSYNMHPIRSTLADQSPKDNTHHHGKSRRSIHLFENKQSHAYPKISHTQNNHLVRAQSLERVDSLSVLSLDIHEDSCYNFLNKRRYQEFEDGVTPLEEFFHKESIAQYKVAQFLAETQTLSPVVPHIVIKRTKKHLLVLDIDETLVHSEPVVEQSIEKPEFAVKKHDRYIEFPNPNGTIDVYGVRFRPYLIEFLERMSQVYDLAVYTASARDYADAVLDQLDPTKTKFVARLYRDHCSPVSNMNIKNMKIFPGNDAILIDNLIYSYAFQLNQGVPICPFVDDMMDVELKDLATILERVIEYESVYQLLQDLLGLDEYYRFLKEESENHNVELTPTIMANFTHSTLQHSKTAHGNTLPMFKNASNY